MRPKFRVDRHFLFLHTERLAVFSERVLRATAENANLKRPEAIWSRLHRHYVAFRNVLDDRHQKQQQKAAHLRQLETLLLLDLNEFADYIEAEVLCRSDVFTTGFRSQTEQRKEAPTRRQQRIANKLGRIGEDTK
jgi:hypothetical protein